MNIFHQHEVPIDIERLIYLRKVFYRNPIVGTCCQILNHYLLPERQLRFVNHASQDDLTMTDEEKDEWDVFAIEMFTQITCWGFVMFTNTLQTIAFCDIDFINFDPSTKKLSLQISEHAKKKYTKVCVVNAFGCCPLENGELVSTMESVIESIEFIEHMKEKAATIETQKVNPDVLCEAADHDNTRTTNTTVTDVSRIQTRHYVSYKGDDTQKSATAIHQQMQEAQSVLSDMQAAADVDTRKRASYRGHIPKQNYMALPPGTKVSKVITSQGRSDLVSVVRMVSQHICALFGVPRSMLINDSVARADTAGTHDCFRISLKRYRKHVKRVISIAAMVRYDEPIDIVLPDAFHGPSEELTKMYLFGMIPYKKYCVMFCDHYNTLAIVKEDPLSEEQKSQLASDCMQSMVTQHHGRT